MCFPFVTRKMFYLLQQNVVGQGQNAISHLAKGEWLGIRVVV